MKCGRNSCKGMLEIIKIHSFCNFHMAEEMQCSDCKYIMTAKEEAKRKFNESVTNFLIFGGKMFDISDKEFDGRSNNGLEISAQSILKTHMREFEIIKFDNGCRDSQYDLLARNGNQSIAIEITRAAVPSIKELSTYLEKNAACFPAKKSNYSWVIHVDQPVSIENIENILCGYEEKYPSPEICSSDILTSYEVEDLAKNGLVYFYGTRNSCSEKDGNINVLHTMTISFSLPENIDNILSIIKEECCKEDNIKKFKLSGMNENHIFIEITSLREKWFDFEQIKTAVKYSIPEGIKIIDPIIDVIWLAVSGFAPSGKTGYKLLKITNHKNELMIENVSQGFLHYVH